VEATAGNLTLLRAKYGFGEQQLERHVDGFRFWLPGFLDTHVHYSQLWNRGLGTDEPLLPWLQEYTFPLEDFFVNSGRMDQPTYDAFVDVAYARAIQHYLSLGVTSAMIYGTSDTNSTLRLAELCAHYNQRCFVGKVNMDHDDGRCVATQCGASKAPSHVDAALSPRQKVGCLGSRIILE
jgi:cytosine/adenosine deaminase-related metal-dependent hydrolase